MAWLGMAWHGGRLSAFCVKPTLAFGIAIARGSLFSLRGCGLGQIGERRGGERSGEERRGGEERGWRL